MSCNTQATQVHVDEDSGARRLVVNSRDLDGARDVSYEFLRREYSFDHVTVTDVINRLSENPLGPYLTCVPSSVRELVEQFPFFSVAHLRAIAQIHGVSLHGRLQRGMCKDALRLHDCEGSCPSVSYVFHVLKRPRHNYIFVPDLHRPSNSYSNECYMKAKENTKKQRQRRAANALEGLAPVGPPAEPPLVSPFPPVQSFAAKREIIREWQVEMSPDHLQEGVCAVCVQIFAAELLVDVVPSKEMLLTLNNNWLPAETRPRTYDIAKYEGAILCCHGMSCLGNIGDLRMCLCCRRSLSSPKPRQPKDAIANFQYYGVSELPVDVKSALACASQFELQLIALARATVITHHYQTKG
ncbi:hypothetical protein M404DRAFT_412618, partial [Pisolithus tinctorius Marx 270]